MLKANTAVVLILHSPTPKPGNSEGVPPQLSRQGHDTRFILNCLAVGHDTQFILNCLAVGHDTRFILNCLAVGHDTRFILNCLAVLPQTVLASHAMQAGILEFKHFVLNLRLRAQWLMVVMFVFSAIKYIST